MIFRYCLKKQLLIFSFFVYFFISSYSFSADIGLLNFELYGDSSDINISKDIKAIYSLYFFPYYKTVNIYTNYPSRYITKTKLYEIAIKTKLPYIIGGYVIKKRFIGNNSSKEIYTIYSYLYSATKKEIVARFVGEGDIYHLWRVIKNNIDSWQTFLKIFKNKKRRKKLYIAPIIVGNRYANKFMQHIWHNFKKLEEKYPNNIYWAIWDKNKVAIYENITPSIFNKIWFSNYIKPIRYFLRSNNFGSSFDIRMLILFTLKNYNDEIIEIENIARFGSYRDIKVHILASSIIGKKGFIAFKELANITKGAFLPIIEHNKAYDFRGKPLFFYLVFGKLMKFPYYLPFDDILANLSYDFPDKWFYNLYEYFEKYRQNFFKIDNIKYDYEHSFKIIVKRILPTYTINKKVMIISENIPIIVNIKGEIDCLKRSYKKERWYGVYISLCDDSELGICFYGDKYFCGLEHYQIPSIYTTSLSNILKRKAFFIENGIDKNLWFIKGKLVDIEVR